MTTEEQPMTEAEARDILETFHRSTIRWGYDGAMKDAVSALLSATRPAPGYIRTSEGPDMRLLGVLPTTKDGCVVGNGAELFVVARLRGAHGRKGVKTITNICEHFGRMYSDRTAAEAAKREGENGE